MESKVLAYFYLNLSRKSQQRKQYPLNIQFGQTGLNSILSTWLQCMSNMWSEQVLLTEVIVYILHWYRR